MLNVFFYVKEWQHIEEAVQQASVLGFGKKLSSLLDRCYCGLRVEVADGRIMNMVSLFYFG
jgi:hypothetical protein